MKPDEFLVLAVRLSASSGEAERRSAISRAYYAIFHAARLVVEDCGVVRPSTAEVHDKLAKCLQNGRDVELAMVGDKLNMFRAARNSADYRLNDQSFTNGKFVALQLAMARETADSLAASHARIPSFRTTLRAYARDVLKLALRGND
ncbi:MAG: hypothetical protein L0211_02880 [Planctomycetaceae bacterium]|nr:hypothetical protein [Planctomycetaceae bacterium]